MRIIHYIKITPNSHLLRKFHFIMTVVWALLVIPTVVFWPESVLWIALISCYANVIGHFGAYQSTRAEESNNG